MVLFPCSHFNGSMRYPERQEVGDDVGALFKLATCTLQPASVPPVVKQLSSAK